MKLTNVTSLPAGWTMGFRRDGREMLVVVVKATYVLPDVGAPPEHAVPQQPLVQADEFTGEPGMSAPRYETDYAHQKVACDVLLVGSAHAPEGRPVTRTEVEMQIGSLTKRFTVVGPRAWSEGISGVAAGEPKAFTVMPLTYDCAFGGTDRTDEARGHTATFVRNPVGRGYWRHTDHIDGQPMPNTEETNRPVTSPNGDYLPMAFSPIGRNWVPRSQFAGTYDQRWIENTAPLWPDDFDERYFQAAPPDQNIAYPQGGETVVLRNLTPDGYREFELPRRRMPMTFIPHKGRDATREAVIDTVVMEPEEQRFTLTWRVSLPLGRSIFDVKETVVGEMPRGWYRARQSPGKPYYRGLAELVKARTGGGTA